MMLNQPSSKQLVHSDRVSVFPIYPVDDCRMLSQFDRPRIRGFHDINPEENQPFSKPLSEAVRTLSEIADAKALKAEQVNPGARAPIRLMEIIKRPFEKDPHGRVAYGLELMQQMETYLTHRGYLPEVRTRSVIPGKGEREHEVVSLWFSIKDA